MKKFTKRLSLLLAVLILLSSVLIACKKDGDDDDRDEGGWSLGTEGRSATPDNIPEDVDLKGYQFNVLCRGNMYVTEGEGDITSETTDPVSRNVYECHIRVQNRLNCKFKYISTNAGTLADTQKEVKIHVEANDYYDYFLLTNNCILMSGLNYKLIDFNDAEFPEYHQPWWWKDVMAELSFDGRTVNFLVGDINLGNFHKMSAFYFNFDLIKERLQMQPQDFYDLVNNGKWTIAKCDELSARCWRDLNGNGDADEGDLFAFPWTGGEVGSQFIWSTRLIDDIYSRDSSGLVTIKLQSHPDVYDVATKVRKLLRDNEGVRDYSATPQGTFDSLIIEEFASNKYVFLAQRFTAACSVWLREMKSLYGIIPYPTLEEGDEYRSFIQQSSSCISAPKIAEKNLEIIGMAIEARCSEAYRYTYDAFFNMALKNKYTNDIESAQMVDIIYKSSCKSFLLEYDSQAMGVTGCVYGAVSGNENVMTLLARKSGAQQAINNFIADTKSTM